MPVAPALTQEITMMSLSPPWNPSTVFTATCGGKVIVVMRKNIGRLHLGGGEVGILQSKSQLLSLLGIERDHLFIHNYESNLSQPLQLQGR